ncbi:MAG TPA: hypothetical protein EYO31_02805 [Phycisphaerales bacterium]|nr:hypothetical protein [Phycisphaerales bacterium]
MAATVTQIDERAARQAEYARINQLFSDNKITLSSIEEAFEELIANADIQCRQEDHGIGHYEYWGATGFDSQIVDIASGHGKDELEWCQREFPYIEDEILMGNYSGFVVTSSQYCSRSDEYYEDGYSTDHPVKGNIYAFSFAHEVLEVEGENGRKVTHSFYRCTATMYWETEPE